MSLYEIPLYRVFWRTRRLFQRLGAEFQPVPGGAPLSPPQRAVLEFLDREDHQTVPELARSRSVSRQHIQVSVNELVDRGWLETVPNPAHRRSPLIALTQAGRERLANAQAIEEIMVHEISRHFPPEDLVTTARTLGKLEDFFNSAAWQEIRQRHIDEGVSQ
ncbi:MAG: MarR family winged helix-turn-helix transcriptional regulator [Gammaproteobacteria bacterium]|nr:MarR family winged helix-turn-helix transcriptional regulator [Gammaproteobacteria bacterium]MDH3505802.1 MarR family winged helix-turn-helix transcriptional regulator [Gammaproteobacteria bacterium]